jgi:hypothetical protein
LIGREVSDHHYQLGKSHKNIVIIKKKIEKEKKKVASRG